MNTRNERKQGAGISQVLKSLTITLITNVN
jgi:hypothetical protein